MGNWIFFIVLIVVLIAFVWLTVDIIERSNKDRQERISRRAKQIESLKESYQQLLKQGDKQAALVAGRKYYSALRGGNLTMYDEQALTNDLSTTK